MKRTVCIVLGGLLYALAACLFIIPDNIALGGTTGLAVLISNYVRVVSAEQISTILNTTLIVIAFLVLGKSMAFGTLLGSLSTTAFIFLFGVFFSDFEGFPIGPIPCALIGAALIGLASIFLFMQDASSGGTDIVALIVKKYSHADISGAMFVTDVAIALSSFLVYGLWGGVYSVIGFSMKIFSLWFFERLCYRFKKPHSSTK